MSSLVRKRHVQLVRNLCIIIKLSGSFQMSNIIKERFISNTINRQTVSEVSKNSYTHMTELTLKEEGFFLSQISRPQSFVAETSWCQELEAAAHSHPQSGRQQAESREPPCSGHILLSVQSTSKLLELCHHLDRAHTTPTSYNFIQIIPRGLAQSFVTMVILNPIKLAIKLNLQRSSYYFQETHT